MADEFLTHARAIRAERTRAAARRRARRAFSELLQSWGGVTLAYRRRLIDAPVLYAQPRRSGEGAGGRHPLRRKPHAHAASMSTAHGLSPKRIHLKRCRWQASRVLPARAVLVAAGTRPNTVLAREDADNFQLDGQYFQALDDDGAVGDAGKTRRKPERGARHHAMRRDDGRAVSFFGDLHPCFAGNVVKAMGGAKQGWPVVSAACSTIAHARRADDTALPRATEPSPARDRSARSTA